MVTNLVRQMGFSTMQRELEDTKSITMVLQIVLPMMLLIPIIHPLHLHALSCLGGKSCCRPEGRI